MEHSAYFCEVRQISDHMLIAVSAVEGIEFYIRRRDVKINWNDIQTGSMVSIIPKGYQTNTGYETGIITYLN